MTINYDAVWQRGRKIISATEAFLYFFRSLKLHLFLAPTPSPFIWFLWFPHFYLYLLSFIFSLYICDLSDPLPLSHKKKPSIHMICFDLSLVFYEFYCEFFCFVLLTFSVFSFFFVLFDFFFCCLKIIQHFFLRSRVATRFRRSGQSLCRRDSVKKPLHVAHVVEQFARKSNRIQVFSYTWSM